MFLQKSLFPSKRPFKKTGWVFPLFCISVMGFSSVQAQQAPDAKPSFNVHTIKSEPVVLWNSFSGRLSPTDKVEVRPEVSGRITDIRFEEGQLVKKGDILFVIDPSTYQATVNQAKAALQTAIQQAEFSNLELKRASAMKDTQAIARQVYDQRASESKIAQTGVESAKAALQQAEIQLERCYVKAPIDGRIGRREKTVGNLVQISAGSPLLTTIINNKEIYADFEVDEQTYMNVVRSSAVTTKQEQEIPVQIFAGNDESKSYNGFIDSFNNQINPSTGTIGARAILKNTDNRLISGLFVQVKMGANPLPIMTIPQTSVGTDQVKKFVYVVGQDNSLSYRVVTISPLGSNKLKITSGLEEGERIVADSLEKIKLPLTITPVEVKPTPAE